MDERGCSRVTDRNDLSAPLATRNQFKAAWRTGEDCLINYPNIDPNPGPGPDPDPDPSVTPSKKVILYVWDYINQQTHTLRNLPGWDWIMMIIIMMISDHYPTLSFLAIIIPTYTTYIVSLLNGKLAFLFFSLLSFFPPLPQNSHFISFRFTIKKDMCFKELPPVPSPQNNPMLCVMTRVVQNLYATTPVCKPCKCNQVRGGREPARYLTRLKRLIIIT